MTRIPPETRERCSIGASGIDTGSSFACVPCRGAKLEVKGSGGGWLNGRTPEQYAKWLDDKAGHPWYEHQKEMKECVQDAEKCNLSKVFIQEPIPRVSTLTLEHKYALNEMAEQNALDSLKTSVERCGIQILHAQVHAKGEANYACTVMHVCVWHRHWEMLRFCIEKGANIETKASGMYWVGGKSVKEYAKKLDDECDHNYYKHVEMVDKCIEEAKADHEDAKSGKGAGKASSSINMNEVVGSPVGISGGVSVERPVVQDHNIAAIDSEANPD